MSCMAFALFNGGREAASRVKAVTPLTVLLRLGSCPMDPSRSRFVRLLRWLGSNARFHLDGDVKQQLGGRIHTVLSDCFPSWVARQVIW